MKTNIFLLSIIIMFGYVSSAAGLQCYDDFNYTLNESINGEGNLGYNWGGAWSVTNDSVFECKEVGGDNYGLFYENMPVETASRAFSTAMTTIAICDVIVRIKDGSPPGVSARYLIYDSSGDTGPEFYVSTTGGTNKFVNHDGTVLASGVSLNTDYMVSITNVNFGTSEYDAQVIGFDKVTGLSFKAGGSVGDFDGVKLDNDLGGEPHIYIDDININSVPEPSTIAFFLIGLSGVVAVRLRKRIA